MGRQRDAGDDATREAPRQRPEQDASVLGVVFYILGSLMVLIAGGAAYTYPIDSWPLNVLPFIGGALVNFGFGAILNHLKALRGDVSWMASVVDLTTETQKGDELAEHE